MNYVIARSTRLAADQDAFMAAAGTWHGLLVLYYYILYYTTSI